MGQGVDRLTQKAVAGFVPPRRVSPEEYTEITCNRCGLCCEDIPAPEDPAAMAALGRDVSLSEDARAFISGLVPARPIPGGWSYRCRHFRRDPNGLGECGIHDRRPDVCRNFPNGGVVRRWADCSWYVWVDDPDAVPVTLGRRPQSGDSAVARLEAFYDALPPEEREVMNAVFRRAASHLAETQG